MSRFDRRAAAAAAHYYPELDGAACEELEGDARAAVRHANAMLALVARAADDPGLQDVLDDIDGQALELPLNAAGMAAMTADAVADAQFYAQRLERRTRVQAAGGHQWCECEHTAHRHRADGDAFMRESRMPCTAEGCVCPDLIITAPAPA